MLRALISIISATSSIILFALAMRSAVYAASFSRHRRTRRLTKCHPSSWTYLMARDTRWIS